LWTSETCFCLQLKPGCSEALVCLHMEICLGQLWESSKTLFSRFMLNDMLVEPFRSVVLEGDLFSGATKVQVGGLDANIELQASDAQVDNLDTVGSLLALLILEAKEE
jgi:hypothetical protein